MKIRIYKLAKELGIDNKKIIEAARRFGDNALVPSNSITPEVADKIRAAFSKQTK